jgi:hypothetical protein
VTFLKKTNQVKKFDKKIHVISQLAGADTPPDIKKIIYPDPNKKDQT